ncbi:MAG: DUF3792 domain-containing protein [Erysipelotrichaceae bacterium]
MLIKCKTILISLGFLLLSTLLCSLVFATLYYNNIISNQFFVLCCWIIGVILYFISGFILGRGIKKKALLHALLIIICLGIFTLFLIEEKNLLTYVELLTKLLSYLSAAIISANKN